MVSGQETTSKTWDSRSTAATVVQGLLVLGPLLIGWFAVRLVSPWFFQPSGWFGFLCWVLQAIAVAIAATWATKKLADRFAPLSALLRLSLVFPDAAPSRFGLALRMGSTKNMKEKVTALDSDIGVAARQAIELVVQLGRHERRTRGHVERVRAYGELIGAELGFSGEELDRLRWGLLLHDVGKLKVPAEILDKDGKPTEEEWDVLRSHPAEGLAMLEPLRPWLGDWIEAASSHHERWAGGGYPAGLVGANIPLAGRICAVADAYDVMTSTRSYKKPSSHDHARAELVLSAGEHFDPEVVRAMLRVGIKRQRSTSVFSWLLEIRGAAEIASQAAQLTVAPIAVTAGIVAGTAAAIMTPGVLPESGPIPGNLAFAPDESTTTTTLTTASTLEPIASTSTVTTPPTTTSVEVADPGSTVTEPEPGEETTTSSATSSTTTGPEGSTTTATTAAPTTQPPTTQAPTTTTTIATTTTTAATTTTTAPTTTTTTTIPTTTTTAPPAGDVYAFLTAGDMPSSLAPDQLESANTVFLFLEVSAYTLTSDLTVREPRQQQWRGVTPWESEIDLPAGTVVCSWFLHADSLDGDGELSPTGTFPSAVLGYVGRSGGLSNTSFFEVPGVDYSYSPSNSFDNVYFDGANMSTVHRHWDGQADHLRIFTAC